MPKSHFVLLANFYGSYLSQSKFDSVAIINNAGIEQLASLGVDKLKQLKATAHPDDDYVVLMIAGLTDVLIKSVEEGKNKLEITPNSAQLLESKMEWAQSMLTNERATVLWVMMPPVSLKMYHKSEGWNLFNIPGMSPGLLKEQSQLNNLMLNYRQLCQKLTTKAAKKITPGLYFTDLVVEFSSDRKSMNLITRYFDADGISPSKKLAENWDAQVRKVYAKLEKSSGNYASAMDGPSSDPWSSLPQSHASSRGTKRDFGSSSASFSRGLLDFSASHSRSRDPEDFGDYRQERDSSPPPKIPSLLDYNQSTSNRPLSYSDSQTRLNQSGPEQLAVQLLAAMSGGNVGPGNVHGVLQMLKSPEEKRRQEEHRAAELRRQAEEERQYILQKRLEEEREKEDARRQEEARRREEARRLEEARRREVRRLEEEAARRREEAIRREEEKRRRETELRVLEQKRLKEQWEDDERRRKLRVQQAEENRLREIQLAAQRTLEQQQKEREKVEAVKRQIVAAQLHAEQKAKMEAVAAAIRVQAQLKENAKMSSIAAQSPAGKTSALERINEKLQKDRLKRESESSNQPPKESMKIDLHIANDPLWKAPVVLFNFVNRNKVCKPLRGIISEKGPSVKKGGVNDLKSRSQLVYRKPNNPPPIASFLKIRVRKPGELTEFEQRVSEYNNRLLELIREGDLLMDEGKFLSYQARKEVDDEKPKRNDKSDTKSNAESTEEKAVVMTKSKPDRRSESPKLETRRRKSSLRARSKSPDRKSTSRSRPQERNRRSAPDSKTKTREAPFSSKREHRRTKERSLPPAPAPKPRWDKSDESDDDLIWDDEPKIIIGGDDDDDVRSVASIKESNLISDAIIKDDVSAVVENAVEKSPNSPDIEIAEGDVASASKSDYEAPGKSVSDQPKNEDTGDQPLIIDERTTEEKTMPMNPSCIPAAKLGSSKSEAESAAMEVEAERLSELATESVDMQVDSNNSSIPAAESNAVEVSADAAVIGGEKDAAVKPDVEESIPDSNNGQEREDASDEGNLKDDFITLDETVDETVESN